MMSGRDGSSGAVRRVAVFSMHTSPLAQPGAGDGGGMNVYVRSLGEALVRAGVGCDILTRAEHPADHLVTLAGMYRNTGAPLHGKRRSAGLKFVATDVEWSAGDGPEIEGPAMSLIMAMVGRAGALTDCSGPGVETLRSRMSPPTSQVG